MPISITIDSNLVPAQKSITDVIETFISNPQELIFIGATSILALVHERIHVNGLRANGSNIGEYSNSYLRTREKNNRGANRRIILSLTRQMENDFSVVEANNDVGLGFNNLDNFKKATFMESDYPGTYFLSQEEEQVFAEAVEKYIYDIFE